MWEKTIALTVVAAITCGVFVQFPKPESTVPFMLLRGTSPLAISIIWTPTMTKPLSDSIQSADGPTTYLFWNNTDQPLTINFPPQRSFGLTEDQLERDGCIPDFMSTESSFVLNPREERRIDGGNSSWTFTGQLEGRFEDGPGWFGWFFEGDDQNSIGTVIAKRFVVEQGVTAGEVEEKLVWLRKALSTFAGTSNDQSTYMMAWKP